MRKSYKFVDSEFRGIPFIDVIGEEFCYEDLYEMLGKHQFTATFSFKPDSESHSKFGPSVTGVIFYSHEEIGILDQALSSSTDLNIEIVKIDSPMPDLSIAQKEDLKYGGVKIADIFHLNILPYKNPVERFDTGEKKIPNIVRIPIRNDPRIDYDILYQNYILGKFEAGTELIAYEKEKFVGITLGINSDRIDPRLLDLFGFTQEQVGSSDNVWYHAYKTKEKHKKITQEEKLKYIETEVRIIVRNFTSLSNEISRSGVNSKDLAKNKEALELISTALKKFEPGILLHGKKQVYWDVDSYLHVVLRHVKQMQIGAFKAKSTLPYRFEDLQLLIEKVLGTVDDEIKRHFEESPGKDFRRSGKMSIPFNGDYYCLQIDKNGRLVTFYPKQNTASGY